ncbi:hypothetical protein PR202_gb23851 [Eleusine coracana subsp. coracana]|uniref:Uncharacterized protein n=1 Tax=Eleusine coracana subsp. coracana TaxID=191504 RepID=A0AAV5FHA0_ELECO|nr:hypothetical protein PR202_gb23851 [Eleusine coracana subsp. coracana]
MGCGVRGPGGGGPHIRARVASWAARPVVYTMRIRRGPFDMYGCDFGWGKALAARSGRANKCDGKASLYPGRDGGIDVEVALLPDHMAALERDQRVLGGRDALTTRKV